MEGSELYFVAHSNGYLVVGISPDEMYLYDSVVTKPLNGLDTEFSEGDIVSHKEISDLIKGEYLLG